MNKCVPLCCLAVPAVSMALAQAPQPVEASAPARRESLTVKTVMKMVQLGLCEEIIMARFARKPQATINSDAAKPLAEHAFAPCVRRQAIWGELGAGIMRPLGLRRSKGCATTVSYHKGLGFCLTFSVVTSRRIVADPFRRLR